MTKQGYMCVLALLSVVVFTFTPATTSNAAVYYYKTPPLSAGSCLFGNVPKADAQAIGCISAATYSSAAAAAFANSMAEANVPGLSWYAPTVNGSYPLALEIDDCLLDGFTLKKLDASNLTAGIQTHGIWQVHQAPVKTASDCSGEVGKFFNAFWTGLNYFLPMFLLVFGISAIIAVIRR